MNKVTIVTLVVLFCITLPALAQSLADSGGNVSNHLKNTHAPVTTHICSKDVSQPITGSYTQK